MTTVTPKRAPLKLFFCYAREDARWRRDLDAHLELLRREGLITTWYDQQIVPGTPWSAAIEEQLTGADLVVFLVSPAFLASEYIAEVEMAVALRRHRDGALRVVPVLLEPVKHFEALELFQLQALPAGSEGVQAVSEWADPVRALDSAAGGIRRAAQDLIIETGGAFEFHAHGFTEAELAALEGRPRERAYDGLRRLRAALVDAVPKRRRERNLLVATWALNKLGRMAPLPDSLFYIAQVISAFDVVALQEIDRRLETLDRLLSILGPEWGYVITDVSGWGPRANNERFAVVYYRPRVAFRNISGEIVLPDDMLLDGRQFARKPLLASFWAGALRFRVCTAHIDYGGGKREVSFRECDALASFLAKVAARDAETVVLAGNFNIRRPDSPAVESFVNEGFTIPPEIIHPSTFTGKDYFDLVGLYLNAESGGGDLRIAASGAFNPLNHVYRDEDAALYTEEDLAFGRPTQARASPLLYSRNWRNMQLSDHVPVWVELETGL